MKSLKAVLPDIGSILGMNHHALYARQQVLTREGLLTVQPGRGPGSGVVASPDSVATLLIALLAGASPADVPHQARAFCAAVPSNAVCPLTGARSLRDAIAAILADAVIAERVNGIMLATSYGHAFVRYDGTPFEMGPEAFAAGKFKSSTFIATDVLKSPLSVSVDITGDIVRAIAALVAKLEVDQ